MWGGCLCLLPEVNSRTARRLSRAKITGSRSYWGRGTSLHISAKILLRAELYQVFWGLVKKYLCDNCDYTVPLIHSMKTCQRLWPQQSSVQSGFGSSGYTGGWMLTDQAWGQLMHKCRCGSLVLLSTSPTDVSQTVSQGPLTEKGTVLGRHANLGPTVYFSCSVLM